jgi:hypothetical protein
MDDRSVGHHREPIVWQRAMQLPKPAYVIARGSLAELPTLLDAAETLGFGSRALARRSRRRYLDAVLSDFRRNSASLLHVGTAGASATARPKRATICESCTAPDRSKSGLYSSLGWW